MKNEFTHCLDVPISQMACLLYGNNLHYLDHLAPLAALLHIPLIVTDIDIEETAEAFYPDIKVQYIDATEIHKYVSQYDAVISCFTKTHFDNYFSLAQNLLQKKTTFIWCPHGNSDKENLEALKEETHLLIYGDQMRKRAEILGKQFLVGNYRKSYFSSHKKFYRSLVQKQVLDFLPRQLNLLYAPTWEDYEKNSSFCCMHSLLEHLPKNYNLIVLLHPNTWLQREFELEKIIYNFKDQKNILFVKNFPPIFPILESAFAYIGDISSIGYDFLFFKRQMFFLSESKKDLPLFQCGSVFSFQDVKQIYKLLEKPKNFSSQQEALKKHVFYERGCMDES